LALTAFDGARVFTNKFGFTPRQLSEAIDWPGGGTRKYVDDDEYAFKKARLGGTSDVGTPSVGPQSARVSTLGIPTRLYSDAPAGTASSSGTQQPQLGLSPAKVPAAPAYEVYQLSEPEQFSGPDFINKKEQVVKHVETLIQQATKVQRLLEKLQVDFKAKKESDFDLPYNATDLVRFATEFIAALGGVKAKIQAMIPKNLFAPSLSHSSFLFFADCVLSNLI
jgi:hypothetical protein